MCLFCRTQRKIFWRKFVIRLFWAPLTSTVGKNNTMIQNCSVSHILQNIFLCVQQNKDYLRMSKLWQNFNFWWTIPLSRQMFLLLEMQMISEGSCDTEDWSTGCWNFSIASQEKNYILKYVEWYEQHIKQRCIIFCGIQYTVVSQRNNKLVNNKFRYNKHYKLGYNRLIKPILVLITHA